MRTPNRVNPTMQPSSKSINHEITHLGAGAGLWIPAILVMLSAVSFTACEEKGPPSKTKQIAPADDFDERADAFSWPDEPSHIVALEFKDRGTIRLGLYDQVAPKTVAHFVDCVTRGVYNDTLFHRVIKDFMIQGGDSGTRKRGPDTTRGDWGDLSVEDEYQAIHHDRGVVSLANRGRPGSAGSQFFIVHQDSHHLDGKYTAFGRVREGIEIVDDITEVETDTVGRWGARNTPLENVILTRAILERGTITKVDRGAGSEPGDESSESTAGGEADGE